MWQGKSRNKRLAWDDGHASFESNRVHVTATSKSNEAGALEGLDVAGSLEEFSTCHGIGGAPFLKVLVGRVNVKSVSTFFKKHKWFDDQVVPFACRLKEPVEPSTNNLHTQY
jgi:hypothetical protein